MEQPQLWLKLSVDISVMLKWLIILYAFLSVWQAYAQDVSGLLTDRISGEPVQFAHVVNLRDSSLALTNAEGAFTIPAEVGDTILFSIIGYELIGYEVKIDWFGQVVEIHLEPSTTVLDEVTITHLPSEEAFKSQVLAYQPVDSSFWYHGMPQVIPREDPTLNPKHIRHPLFIAAHPISGMYYNFSKREKERRKFYQVQQNQPQQNRVYQKFTRTWVNEVTGLEGDKLTDFIAYCNYSLKYLDETPLYLIREDMLAKLAKFQNLGKS